MLKIREVGNKIKACGLTVAVKNFKVVDNKGIVKKYYYQQLNRVLVHIDQQTRGLGHFDFNPEISIEVQNKYISSEQYTEVQRSVHGSHFSSRCGFKQTRHKLA